MAITIAQVNKAIKAAGIDAELVKGRGYFYFVGEGVVCDADGVYVSKIADLSLADWLEEAKERKI